MVPEKLKPGDPVIVHVGADVMGDGASANPRARFVRYHFGTDWADVVMDDDHIGSNASREAHSHLSKPERESKARTLSVPISLLEAIPSETKA